MCVCVCVCMITQKYLSRNMKLEYFVVYEKITQMSLILSLSLPDIHPRCSDGTISEEYRT